MKSKIGMYHQMKTASLTSEVELMRATQEFEEKADVIISKVEEMLLDFSEGKKVEHHMVTLAKLVAKR